MTKYWPIILLCLLIGACKSDPSSSSSSDNTTTTNTTTTESTTSNNSEPTKAKHVEASAIAPLIGLWNNTLAMTDDLARKKDYEGRWIQFEGDQTFTNGKWGDQTNSGTFEFDSSTKILKLYFENQKDGTFDWRIKIDKGVMIWLGNADINETGDQIRLVRATERPQDIQ